MAVRKSYTLIFLLILTVVLVLLSYVGLRIQQITCTIDQQPCPPEVTSLFNNLSGQSVLFFDKSQLNLQLAANQSYQLHDYHLQLPNKLVIQISPQTVAYTIQPESKATKRAITTEGKIIEPLPDKTHISLIINNDEWQRLEQNQVLAPELHIDLQSALAALDSAGIQVQDVYLPDRQTLVLYLPDKPSIIVDLTQVSASVARLNFTLNQLDSQAISAQVQEIDVRYKLPVLRTSPTIPRHTSY